MNAGFLLVGVLLVLITTGVPIAFTILGATLITQFFQGMDMQIFVQRLYGSNDSFALLAIPFFFIAGELMLQGGISRRIINFTQSLFGWIRGSLAIISFVACAFFGAISGSAFATTAAIGGLMFPEMIEDGYEEGFATVIQAVGGTLGTLIPPSICCVVYAVLVQVSAGDMFKYIAPVGILATLFYTATALIMMRRDPTLYRPGKKAARKVVSGSELWLSFKDAVWALLSPVIILGGIYAGIFTPTESAIIATVYALIVGFGVYRELTFRIMCRAMLNATLGSAAVMFIIDAAAPFSWMLTVNQIPQTLASFATEFIHSPYMLLLIINVLFLIGGMFMETNSMMMIMIPLMLPMVKAFDINLIHLGVVTVLNMTIGCITPPFGASIFVASGVTKTPISLAFRRVMPFIISALALLALITYVPLLWL